MSIYEIGPIRPPSESESLLIRVTRGCHWNKCKFCGLYKNSHFEMRPITDILTDIKIAAEKYQNSHYNTCFLQDADAFVLSVDKLMPIVQEIKKQFLPMQFITTYARADSILQKSADDMLSLRKAGLNHLYIGMETGSDNILNLVNKGVNAQQIINAGLAAKKAGMIVSVFTLFGLGGKKYSNENAIMTAKAINIIRPDFIRVHATAIKSGTELGNMLEQGLFDLVSEDEMVMEQKLMLENLDELDSIYLNEHSVNLLLEVRGSLKDKNKMLASITEYLAMDTDTRQLFILGRRLGLVRFLSDISNPAIKSKLQDCLRQLSLHGSFNFSEFCNYLRSNVI